MNLYKKTLSLLVLATLALTLPACSTVKPSLTAERPKDEAFRTELKKEMSTRDKVALTVDKIKPEATALPISSI